MYVPTTYLTSARRQTSGIGTTQFIGMALKVNVHLGESRKLNQLKKTHYVVIKNKAKEV